MTAKKQTNGNMTICLRCNKLKPHSAKGLCASCYSGTLPKKIGTCVECKRERPIYAKGKCSYCYSKPYMQAYFKRHPEKSWGWSDRLTVKYDQDKIQAAEHISKTCDRGVRKDEWHAQRNLEVVKKLRTSAVGKSFADVILTFTPPTQKALIMDGIFLKKREKELSR